MVGSQEGRRPTRNRRGDNWNSSTSVRNLAHTREKLYHPSDFLPGRVCRVPHLFLVDTWCGTNFLFREKLDQLPSDIKITLEKCVHQEYLVMVPHTLLSIELFDQLSSDIKRTLQERVPQEYLANGSLLLLFELVHWEGIWSVQFQAAFVVGRIIEQAILVMPFLERHGCQNNCCAAAFQLDSQEPACNDCYERSLYTNVFVSDDPTGGASLLSETVSNQAHPQAPHADKIGRKGQFLYSDCCL